jgi:AraC family transcriptional regulator, transcriptional activator for feuABC-ybbA operon
MLNIHPIESYKITIANLHTGLSIPINENRNKFYLIYISSGKGTLDSKEKRLKVEEGKSYFLTEDALLTSASSVLLSVYMLSWSKERDVLSVYLSRPLSPQASAKMVPMWEELRRWEKEDSLSAKCRFQAQLWEMLAILTDETEVDRIEEAVELIRRNLAKPYTIAELATKANMSPVSFSRAFRNKMGMSPKEFLNEERMKAAKFLMLQNKGITAKEVALKLGMQDEFYFSRLFKIKEGLPPSIFMKRAKERIAIVSQLFLQDHLLSLGIQPVAAPSYPSVYPSSSGVPRYLEKELHGTILLNAEKTFLSEEILLTQPDRIIKTPLHNSHLQTVLLSQHERVHHLSLKTDWIQYLYEIASMLGLESHAESIEKNVRSLEHKVRDELCPLTKKGKWAVIWIRPEEIRLYGYGGHTFLDLLFQVLGFQPHPDLDFENYRIVSLREVAELNPDKLLILWSHEKDVWKTAHLPEWKMIRAVQTGEVYYPTSHEWDPWGPLGRRRMLEELPTSLLKAKLKA